MTFSDFRQRALRRLDLLAWLRGELTRRAYLASFAIALDRRDTFRLALFL